jgi:diguanylate cyclase (GGDEF)-like protein
MDSPIHSHIPRPDDEAQRLEALHRYGLLDSDADADFDLLTEVAAALCGTPYAFISLVDAERVWYKSSFGKRAKQSKRDDDYCSWAVLEDEMLSIPDLAQDARTASISMTVGAPSYRMYNGANLITPDGMRIGTLCVLDTKPGVLAESSKQLLMRLARQVVALMELRRRDRELEAALAEMQRLATEDGLTGLLNRRAWLEKLEEEIERGRRFGTSLGLILFDLDHFKQINDNRGHAMGDAVLRGVGDLMRTRLRVIDSAGRYGGEEFCVLLPGSDMAGALTVAESLRAAIEAHRFELDGSAVSATASFGVISTGSTAMTSGSLLKWVDAAMYEAKHAGRNRVQAAYG